MNSEGQLLRKVHPGLCENPELKLGQLFEEFV